MRIPLRSRRKATAVPYTRSTVASRSTSGLLASSLKRGAIVLLVVVTVVFPAWDAAPSEETTGFWEQLATSVFSAAWDVFAYANSIRIRWAIDYRDPITWHFLYDQVNPEHRTEEYTLAKVCDIWDYCWANWKYVPDPTLPFDSVSQASQTITAGLRGDCDDFAVLVAAGVRVAGGTVLVVSQDADDPDPGHAFALVYIGSSKIDVVCNLAYVMLRYGLNETWLESGEVGLYKDEDGSFWLNLDWSASHPGGNWWTRPDRLLYSYALPSPSVWGLLLDPILYTPVPPAEFVQSFK